MLRKCPAIERIEKTLTESLRKQSIEHVVTSCHKSKCKLGYIYLKNTNNINIIWYKCPFLITLHNIIMKLSPERCFYKKFPCVILIFNPEKFFVISYKISSLIQSLCLLYMFVMYEKLHRSTTVLL